MLLNQIIFSRRNFFVKSLSVVFVFSLFFISGCQNTALNSNSPDNNQVTKITFWHGINPPENRAIFNELLTQFNTENPDIQVEALYVGQPDEQLPKIIASIAGDQPPDILWYVPQLTGKLVELQALKPLQEWWNNSAIKDEIDPGMLSTMELDNNIWSVPFATNNSAVFYRPSLFEKAGIKETPKTWEEFAGVAKKLTQDTNNDGKIDQNGMLFASGKGEFTVFVWLPFIFSANGEIIQNNQPNLVSEGTEKALNLAVEMVKENSAILSQPDRGYELDNFINGKVAMQVTGPWTLAQLKQSNIDYDVFPIPIIKQPATVLGGENLYVFKTNPQQEEASLRFLKFILGEKFQTQWALKTGYLPINLNAQNSSEYQSFIAENPAIKVFLEQMKVAKSRPIITDYPALSENLGRSIESSLLQIKTPIQALEESQKKLELQLQ